MRIPRYFSTERRAHELDSNSCCNRMMDVLQMEIPRYDSCDVVVENRVSTERPHDVNLEIM